MRGWFLVVTLWPGVAAAQFVGHPTTPPARPFGGYRIEAGRDAADIRERIGNGRRSGQLSRTEARRARGEAAQLDTLTDRYGVGGLSDAEARELRTRALVLRAQVDTRRAQGFGGGAARQRGR